MSSDKLKKLKKGVGKWTSFYRENPHRLAIDYLGMKWLKPFQQALIVMCFKYNYTMIIASRGMGKSLIAAIVCVLKARPHKRRLKSKRIQDKIET